MIAEGEVTPKLQSGDPSEAADDIETTTET